MKFLLLRMKKMKLKNKDQRSKTKKTIGCRAKFGIFDQTSWCKSCRNKKKCSRVDNEDQLPLSTCPPDNDSLSLSCPAPIPNQAAPSKIDSEKILLAQPANGSGVNTNMTATEDLSQVAPFLAGKKLNLAGFDEETQQDYTDWITEAGGEVVNSDFDGVLDYFIVPVDKATTPKHKSFS